ncbi:hypothetical protein LTR36_001226 [Oleoguttula mirabilis]|uniref:ABM domain-containing protein n=1 Tax=Oleoguttula mirabilis TaxID=1507867 RepID=A0AAV9JN70_9PEZI|nr:hypothetical protein LTR36_001226 [Oleoguttula mirabilis]
MGDGIALFCTLHPESQAKQERCLDLLGRAAREYYPTPQAKCTTWSYFTPFPPPKPDSTTKPPVIGGLEVYTSKAALQHQVEDPVYFQHYHDTVKRERLYSQPEELVAWHLSEGFIARQINAEPFGGVLISVTKMTCKDRGEVLAFMHPFAHWVRVNEPGVLTYAIFTRPKAPKEILLFVRYEDTKALKGHDKAPEHQVVVKKLGQMVDATSTTLWKEVKDSFVSNAVGGDAANSVVSKL